MEAQWDIQLLAHPAAAEELGGADDQVLFKGLRVRMGIHVGAPRPTRDPATRHIGYIGPDMNIAAKITAVADGGQVLVSSSLRKRHKKSYDGKLAEAVSFASAGHMNIPGDPVGINIYEQITRAESGEESVEEEAQSRWK
eukprot:TRINITY_DN1523_c0_g2_i1.p1 TRINITY_DN1523_c0_g2~~TRINITY_DN1523_c0_g2_i1.p1  ORF type:complete len:140 (+),score=20.88 TRINITY_DN1523_c0_g2_i1:395-814(+)